MCHIGFATLVSQEEDLEQVERAFVQVDYQKRELPEHKTDWTRSSSALIRSNRSVPRLRRLFPFRSGEFRTGGDGVLEFSS